MENERLHVKHERFHQIFLCCAGKAAAFLLIRQAAENPVTR